MIINEKLNQLSGNAQRTLFVIVKQLLIQGKNKITLTFFKFKTPETFYFSHFLISKNQNIIFLYTNTISQ